MYNDVISMYTFSEMSTWCTCWCITWRNCRNQENERNHGDGGAIMTGIAT